jgi:Kef-type K+ transport system membrane component KefB
MNVSTEYQYLIIVSLILLLPKMLLRFRIPPGITALILGCISINFLEWFQDDQLIITLSRLGITSLFVFAGMEIELNNLRKNFSPLCKHLAKSFLIIALTSICLNLLFGLSVQVSIILAIALFTPSAGFIINSLKNYELTEEEIYWVKLKSISKEIAAIVTLFIALQLNDLGTFIQTKFILITLFCALPFIFKFYLKFIAPYAPKTEVSFLVIIAFLTGVLTKKLGTHYLVGAFATGLVAGQFNHFIKSDHSKRIENSLAAFFSIFVPFYFFRAGLIITKDFFTLTGLAYGLGMIVICVPIRIASVFFSLKLFIKEFWDDRMKISISLMPNLIFGLVILGILKNKFQVDNNILSGLVVYTLAVSILPAIFFKKMPPEEFDLSRVKNGDN